MIDDYHTYKNFPNKNQINLVDDFFFDKSNETSAIHDLEESPCYSIIGKGKMETLKQTYYFCILHQDVWSIDIRYIENHCKCIEADNHRTQILRLLSSIPIPRPNKDWKNRKNDSNGAD